MVISFSACKRDESIAVQTLEWARQLDGKLDYDCILSLGDGINQDPIIGAARQLFRNVTVLEPHADDSWPLGKNQTFQHLVRYLDDKKNKHLFFWFEPDSIPLKKGWLKTIEDAHVAGGKPFSGYVHEQLGQGQMECVGVYPHNVMSYSRNAMLCRAAPWDQCMRFDGLMNDTHRLNHILQFVHDIDGFPPTFPKDSALLNKDAVLFHASKDGSLIEEISKGKIRRLLQAFKSDKPAVKKEPIVVVFVVGDGAPKITQNGNCKAILAYASDCPIAWVKQWDDALLNACMFHDIRKFVAQPSRPIREQVKEYMARQGAPWVFS